MPNIVITVARKPLSESTVAKNVLKHGTGGLNIDASRIGYQSESDLALTLTKNPGREENITTTVYGADRPQQRVTESGRWPANVILVHLAGCERAGTKTVKGAPPTPSGFDRFNASLAAQGYRPHTYQKGEPEPPSSRLNANGTETIDAWECVEGCPVRGLDEQSGASRFFKQVQDERLPIVILSSIVGKGRNT